MVKRRSWRWFGGGACVALAVILTSACSNDVASGRALQARPLTLDGTSGIWTFGCPLDPETRPSGCGDPFVESNLLDEANWNVQGAHITRVYFETVDAAARNALAAEPPQTDMLRLRIYLDSSRGYTLSADLQPQELYLEQEAPNRVFGYVPVQKFLGTLSNGEAGTDPISYGLRETENYIFRGILDLYSEGQKIACSDLWSYEPGFREGYQPPVDIPCAQEQ